MVPLCAEKSFSFSVALHELKKQAFSANQKTFFCTSLSLQISKATHFHKPKALLLPKLFLFPPKTTLFHPPPNISTPLNLLSTKNTAGLLLFALILCCKAGASHRFKSLPAIPDEVAASCKTGYLMITGHFRCKNVSTGDLNRGSQGFAPRAFWLLFARCKK